MRIQSKLLLACALLLPYAAQPQGLPSREAQGSPRDWATIVELVRPAVVTIETDDALGTGFIVRSNGTLVTNHHVISEAKEIAITLPNGDVYKRAYVLRTDKEKDIAILRIEATDLPIISLANSDAVRSAEEVMTIGTPNGLEQTVSTGIISAIRLLPEGYRAIQTTAPISPGSSGGPLLNRSGESIGIMAASIASGQNLNFAVPINYVRAMLETLAMSTNVVPEAVIPSPAVITRNVTPSAPPAPRPVPPPLPASPAPSPVPPASPPQPGADNKVTTSKSDSLVAPATIWLYRTKSLTDSMLNPTIYSRGRILARLEKGQFFALSVPAGTYYFSWTDRPNQKEEARITVALGGLAFFKVRYREIKPVGLEEALKDFRSLRAIESGNVRSPDVLTKSPFDLR